MKSLKIVAISDTRFQNQDYQRMIDKLEPNIVVLAGDCDEEFFSSSNDFYDFLHYTGKKSKVLVIKGNHDDPKWGGSKSRYSIKKINSIKGCTEISGKSVNVDGLKFLGIDYESCRINANLLPLLEKHGNHVDIIISHGEISKIRRFANLKPLIVINGHTMGGVYSVDEVPIIMSNNIGLALIEIKQNKVETIEEYQIIYKLESERNGKSLRYFHVGVISDKPKANKKNYEWLNKPSYKTFKKYFKPFIFIKNQSTRENML